ncbi:MAG: FHA domain-containing protein [Actinomycetales bacterium]|nr:FHA domain-containing protein [Actinomycetales bacterium]
MTAEDEGGQPEAAPPEPITALREDPADSGPLPRLLPGAEGPPPPGSLRLRVIRGAPETVELMCSGPATIGRDDGCDLLFDDVSVSRRHAAIEPVADGWAIVDVGSLNGTYLNRERIERATLREGDEVQIGRFRMTVALPPPAADSAETP